MTDICKLIVILLSIHFSYTAEANKDKNPSKIVQLPEGGWTTNPFENKAFIENKGQYDGKNLLENSRIYYGTEESGVNIFFTKEGLTYRFNKTKMVKSEEENKDFSKATGQEKKKEEHKMVTEVSTVNLLWLGANKNVEIIAESETNGYYSYIRPFT